MLDLWLTPEEHLDGITLGDWFSPAFFNSVYWLCWSTMFAFWPYHSVMEARRYMLRYADLTGSKVQALEGILHPQYNEYHSIRAPLRIWLESQGVKFRTSTTRHRHRALGPRRGDRRHRRHPPRRRRGAPSPAHAG